MKKVNFDLNKNTIHYTYSKKEYNRFQIDSILYLYNYKKLSILEWIKIQTDLKKYKVDEMCVHIDSIQYTNLN